MTDRKTAPEPGPGILDIAPYIGGEAKIEGIEKPIRLASNESALGPSKKAMTSAMSSGVATRPSGTSASRSAAIFWFA